jgi:hypothetical protein
VTGLSTAEALGRAIRKAVALCQPAEHRLAPAGSVARAH